MNSLLSIIKVLRPSEKKLIHHYYSRVTNSENRLRLKLFNLVVSGSVSTDEQARDLLDGAASGSAYSHLKSRLKGDILNVLLMQETGKRLAQGNRAAELDCRKKVAQSYLLLLRGEQEEGMKVLRKAMLAANKYELFAERLQLNHLLRQKFFGASASSELVRLNMEIANDMEAYQAYLKSEEQSIILSSPDFLKDTDDKPRMAEWAAKVQELRKIYQKYKFARIGFWYYLASTEYNAAIGEQKKVVDEGLKFLKLVETHPAVKSKNNIAGVAQTLGSAYLELRNFNHAVKYFSRSEKLFAASGFNRLNCMQYLVHAHIANQDIQAAFKIVPKALSHPRIDARPHLKPRWMFLQASMQFLNGDVDASFRTLNQEAYLMRQQDEWNIQFRLLELLQMVEMNDEEWMEFKVEAFRKFLARNKKLDTKRVRGAIDILLDLWRKSFDFDALSDKSLKLLQHCISETPGFEWDPLGAEVVRFDLWIQEKRSP